MKNEVKKINFKGGELLGVKAEDGKVYLGVKKACLDIGLSENQCKSEIKKVQEDPLLSLYSKKLKVENYEGTRVIQNRECVCLELKVIALWLASINRKSLNQEQYSNIIKLINWSISSDFEEYKYESKIYTFESLLRDEILENQGFSDILITDKEVVHQYGRTDLEGIDTNGNECCIELKKNVCFTDTKDQLMKYKNSKDFDRVIYVANQIDDDFEEWCNYNGIECFTYNRNLEFHNKQIDIENKIRESKYDYVVKMLLNKTVVA